MQFKPRNPMIVHLVKRKSGAHDKSNKAKRRKEKQQLQREYGVTAAQHPFKVPGQGSSPCAPTKQAWQLIIHEMNRTTMTSVKVGSNSWGQDKLV